MVPSKEYSGDSKLGKKVWATYRGKQTCPECPLKKNGCYAEKSYAGIAFARATENYGNEAETITAYLAGLPKGDKIRHHVSGDFMIDGKIDNDYLTAVLDGHIKRTDLKGWTYTHAWRLLKNTFKDIASLTINASCDNIQGVKEARALGYDTCLVVDKDTAPISVIEGEKIVICPNQVQAKRGVKLTCSDCMLCFKKDRNFTVGFRKH
jgi:hypothetical protein